MDRIIALEEHFAINDTLGDPAGYLGDDVWPELSDRLLDIHGRRVELVDRHGIEMMILSLNAPAVQAIADASRAVDIARRANELVAERVQAQLDRFSGVCGAADARPGCGDPRVGALCSGSWV